MSLAEPLALVDVNELARRLGVSETTAWGLLKKDPRAPRPVKVGQRSTRFLNHDISKFIMELTADAAIGDGD